MASFTNQATLRYNGNTIDSNVVTGELLEVLSAAKTAVRDTYAPGETVTYVISIQNTGTTAFTGLTVTDDLGGYAFGGTTLYPLEYVTNSLHYYLGGVLQTAPTVPAGPPLTITGITVPAGGSALLVYEAQVTEFAPPGLEQSIVNTAVISGGSLAAPITVTATVNSTSRPALTISKSICPATVTASGQLTYTFVIQNTGNIPVTAADQAAVTDTFDPILDAIRVTFNGEAWTEPEDYTYDRERGLFATVPGKITVPAAAYTQDATTGAWTVTPGVSVLTVSGTV